MAQALFMLFAVAFYGGAHLYAGRRLFAGLGLSGRGRRIAWGVVLAMAVVPLVLFLGGRVLFEARGAIAVAGFGVMGVSSILIVLVALIDVVRLGEKGVRRFRGEETMNPSRRAFLGRVANVAAIGGAGGLSALGYSAAVSLPGVKEVDVPIPDLPEGLEGFRIVQLTDIHVGLTIDGEYLDGVVEIANAQGADLVAVTGDLVDGYVNDLLPEVSALSRLKSRHGTFFVTGNHEYYWDGPAWCAALADLGLTVLTNEHRVLDHDGAALVVAGITDHRTGARVGHDSDPGAAVSQAPAGAPVLMLAHQPRSALGVARAGAQVMICGHTHGGQYFPMNVLVHLFQPYVAGLHRLQDTWVYVSRGTGYWGPPNRLGSPSEVTLLRLRRA